MAKKNKVGNEYILLTRTPEEAYPIPSSEWNKIKDIAKGAKCPTRWYGFFGSISIGILASSLLQFIINCVKSNKFELDIYLALFIVFSVISMLLFFLDNERNKSIENIGERIISEMKDIEDKYQKVS